MFSFRNSLFVLGLTLTAAMILTIAAPAPANADIYYDTFTASDGLLVNHTPDVTTGGAVWSTNSNWTFNIASNQAEAADNAIGTLPFTPVAGKVYSLSVDVNVTPTNSTSWACLGFAPNAGITYYGNAFWDDCSDFMLVRGNGGTMEFPGVGTSGNGGGHTGTSVTAGSTNTFTMVLNTTGANWVGKCFINGNSTPDWTYTYTSNPSIGYIMIGDVGGVTATFDNLTFTSTPEPGTLLLLAIGLTGLLAYAWRKRR